MSLINDLKNNNFTNTSPQIKKLFDSGICKISGDNVELLNPLMINDYNGFNQVTGIVVRYNKFMLDYAFYETEENSDGDLVDVKYDDYVDINNIGIRDYELFTCHPL
jgi:hypothetical protein